MSFLHSELSKQIAFPRKALDVDFGLYEGGLKGRVSYLDRVICYIFLLKHGC